jgi:hypothetical protein
VALVGAWVSARFAMAARLLKVGPLPNKPMHPTAGSVDVIENLAVPTSRRGG